MQIIHHNCVTSHLNPNQWIILLTMLIFKRHLQMYHTAVSRTYSWLSAPNSWHGTTPGPQRSWAESRRLLLARDYSWPVTPGSKQHPSLLDRCQNDGLFRSRLYSTLPEPYNIVLHRLPNEPNVNATLD